MADRGEYRQAAGAFAEGVIRSVELIVQPDAHAAPGPLIVAVAVEPICGLPRGAPASGARRGPDWVSC